MNNLKMGPGRFGCATLWLGKMGLLVLSVMVLWGGVAAAGTGSQAPVTWAVDGMVRVGKTERPIKPTNYIKLYAARGEVESFQVVVRAETAALSNVRFELGELKGPNKEVIPKSAVTLYREHYIQVKNSSFHMGDRVKRLPPGWYPDALIPFLDRATQKPPLNGELKAIPFDLATGFNQPIWGDIRIPRQALPGVYQGEYIVTSTQGVARGKVSLRVWDFELPRKVRFKSAFQYWPKLDQAADEELLRHKLTPLTVDPAYEPELIEKWGLRYTNLGLWSKANHQSNVMTPEPKVSELAQLAAKHRKEIMLYNYTADEIDGKTYFYKTLKAWARNLHQAGVKNLVTMKPIPELMDDGSGTGRSVVDIWVLLPKMYQEAGANVAQALKKGDEVWSYNCLVQDNYSPKWLLDYEPMNFRIQPGFISQKLGLTGMLYWCVNNWESDPWKSVESIHNNHYFNGEGILVYPGAKVGVKGVVPSMRLKWLRDGVEDYEYIQLLKDKEYFTWTAKVTEKVGTDWHNWTRDPKLLEAARREMGAKLEKIMRKLAEQKKALAAKKAGKSMGASKPSKTKEPATTSKSGETIKPSKTKEPATTSKPGETSKPSKTKEPVTTSKPKESSKPEGQKN